MQYSHDPNQLSIFDFNKVLKVQIDPEHELVHMRALIPWDNLLDIVSKKYLSKGRPSRSILLLIGLEILKRKYLLSDDELFQRFKTDIAFQYFCGFNSFSSHKLPKDSSIMTKFRNRLDFDTLNQIENAVASSLMKHIPKKRRHSIIVDTTCTPANITHPTDTKLVTKIINKFIAIGKKIKIGVIRGKRKIHTLIRYFNLKKNKTKKEIVKMRKMLVRKAKSLLTKIANHLDKSKQEVSLKVKQILEVGKTIIEQQDKRNKSKTNIIENRIVSLHEPGVRPIKRGKDKASCEFGKKVAFSVIGESLMVSSKIDNSAFDDREMIQSAITKHNQMTGRDPTEIICDRGGHNKKNHKLLKEKRIKDGIQRLGKQKNKPTRVQKRQRNRRSVIEGKIGTAKQFYGLDRNRYKEDNGNVYTTFSLLAMNTTCIVRRLAS